REPEESVCAHSIQTRASRHLRCGEVGERMDPVARARKLTDIGVVAAVAFTALVAHDEGAVDACTGAQAFVVLSSRVGHTLAAALEAVDVRVPPRAHGRPPRAIASASSRPWKASSSVRMLAASPRATHATK